VGVLNGIAHLAGCAPSTDVWAAAEQVTASIPGVRGIVNRIEAPGAPSPARTVNLNLENYPPGKNGTRINVEKTD